MLNETIVRCDNCGAVAVAESEKGEVIGLALRNDGWKIKLVDDVWFKFCCCECKREFEFEYNFVGDC